MLNFQKKIFKVYIRQNLPFLNDFITRFQQQLIYSLFHAINPQLMKLFIKINLSLVSTNLIDIAISLSKNYLLNFKNQ